MFGLFNFLHTILRTSKSIGNNTMKKCYSLLRWPCLLQDVLNKTFTVQNKPAAVAPKGKPSPIISSFLEIGRKTVDAAKICGGAENVVKTETQQTFVNVVARFYYFRHLYSAGSACVLLTIIAWVAHRYGQLYLLLINILLGSFQLFLHSDQPLSEGEIIRSAVSASRGRLHYPRRRPWWLHALTTGCWCATDDDQRQHHLVYFSACASANSLRVFCIGAATSRWRICMSSNCRVRQLQFSGIFVARLCR